MLVCSDDNDRDEDNSDGRLFLLDKDGRIMFSVGESAISSPSSNTGEDGGVEYVSNSSTIFCQAASSQLLRYMSGEIIEEMLGSLFPLIPNVPTLYISTMSFTVSVSNLKSPRQHR